MSKDCKWYKPPKLSSNVISGQPAITPPSSAKRKLMASALPPHLAGTAWRMASMYSTRFPKQVKPATAEIRANPLNDELKGKQNAPTDTAPSSTAGAKRLPPQLSVKGPTANVPRAPPSCHQSMKTITLPLACSSLAMSAKYVLIQNSTAKRTKYTIMLLRAMKMHCKVRRETTSSKRVRRKRRGNVATRTSLPDAKVFSTDCCLPHEALAETCR
mmetsp:Transcript_51905/g.121446  ORF Transcript_51905/g.121446 Transcript_51905/m.121446 type:complete len:215 (+) Transcript_51905:129-773(+)